MKRRFWIILVCFIATPARADNCSGLNDCQNQVAVWAAIIGGLIVACVVLWAAAAIIGELAILEEVETEIEIAEELATPAEVTGTAAEAEGGAGEAEEELSAQSRSQLEDLKDQFASQQAKPTGIQDSELSELFDNAYREGAEAGNGSSAGAAEQEILTGEPVKGKWHIQKSSDQMRQLESWFRNNPDAAMTDVHAAENYLRQLRNLDWTAARNNFPQFFQ